MIRPLRFLPSRPLSLAVGIAIAVSTAPLAAQHSTGAEAPSQEQDQEQITDLAPAETLRQIFAHSGKVMQLPTGERYVLYLPLETLFVLNGKDRIYTAAKVSADDDRSIVLHWQGGDVERIDLLDISDIQFLDEAPAFTKIMDEQILGKPLGSSAGPLPAGTQLAEGGVVFSEAGDFLGHWDLRSEAIVFVPEDGESTRVSFSILADAVSTAAADTSLTSEPGGN